MSAFYLDVTVIAYNKTDFIKDMIKPKQANPYDIAQLMDQTRKLAVSFYQSTGNPLPISHELARYDVQQIFSCDTPQPPLKGVDFIGLEESLKHKRILVKSRVVFNPRNTARMGAFQLSDSWDTILLVIYNAEYQPEEIYCADREDLAELFTQDGIAPKKGFSIAKFKSISQLIWDPVGGKFADGV